MHKNNKLPLSIWALGFVSLLMDVSSEMIHSLLPLFLVGTLGASAITIGLIEGLAESTALICKVFSGVLSDYFRKRKLLAVIGYGLGALSKPLFALAGSAGFLLGARLLDRIGKGVRGAPRDALVADLVAPEQRGAAFGLRQSLDTVGAFIGPLLAVGLMLLWANDFRAIFWVAAIPASLAVILLWFSVKEPKLADEQQKKQNPINKQNLNKLSASYWWIVTLGALFSLARFSEAFLVLKAETVGVQLAFIPLVMVAMNLVYALSAYPFGKLSDRMSSSGLLLLGLFLLFTADVLLALADKQWLMLVGMCFWGLHLGVTQGLFNKLVADTIPAELRGTGYGFFNLVSGIAILLASLIAGMVWQWYGPAATFWIGAGICGVLVLMIGGKSLRGLDSPFSAK